MSAAPESFDFTANRDGVTFTIAVSRESVEDAVQRSVDAGLMRDWVMSNMDAIMAAVDRKRPRPMQAGTRIIVTTQDVNP